MASDVMSLFGMNPNVIQQNRVQGGVDQASRMSADYAIGAAGGGMLGAGINSAFGLQTPDMAQAQGIKDSMQGADLNTPAGLRSAAQKLMMNGDYSQAMALHTRANQLEATGVESTRATEDRALGQSRNVIVRPASTNAIGDTTPAITHSVTQYPDGRIADATQGKEYPTYAAWMASLKRGAGGDDTDDEDSFVENLSPSEGGSALEQEANEFDAAIAQEMASINPDNTNHSLVVKKDELVRLEDNMKDIYTYLFSGARRDTGDRTAKAKELLKIKERLRELGYTENKIESLSAGFMPELVGP